MSRLLLRLARRLSSWEGELPLEEIQQYEFRRSDGEPDLRPSVYEVEGDGGEVVRACAEHVAAIPLDPPRQILGIDSRGLGDAVLPADGSPQFSFIKTRHREVRLADRSALLGFIAHLKQRIEAGQSRRVPKRELVSYARRQVAAGDSEWLAVVQGGAGTRWLRELRET